MTSLLEGLLILVSLLLPLVIGVTLVEKTGLNRWLGLLVIVPGANLILILYLLSGTWPIRRELAIRRLRAGEGDMEDGWIAYREAARLQKIGAVQEALTMFQLLECRFPGSTLSNDARISRTLLGLPAAS